VTGCVMGRRLAKKHEMEREQQSQTPGAGTQPSTPAASPQPTDSSTSPKPQ
jgi:hypothetical protein